MALGVNEKRSYKYRVQGAFLRRQEREARFREGVKSSGDHASPVSGNGLEAEAAAVHGLQQRL